MTRKSVMDEIKKRNEVHTIQITGDIKNKADGFYILMTTQSIGCTKNETYHGIKNSTIELLEKAEIKFRVLAKGEPTNEEVVKRFKEKNKTIKEEIKKELDKDYDN